MKWFLYNIGFLVAYLLMTPGWLLRMSRRGGYRRGFLQRLGYYGVVLEKRLASRERVWIHAVSVGEVHVAKGEPAHGSCVLEDVDGIEGRRVDDVLLEQVLEGDRARRRQTGRRERTLELSRRAASPSR